MLRIGWGLLLVGCGDGTCDLALESLRRVGGEAIDCGVYEAGQDPAPVRACVETAYGSGVPFVVQEVLTADGLRRVGQTYDGETLWQTWSATVSTGETRVEAQICDVGAPSTDPSVILLLCQSEDEPAREVWCGE